MKMFKTIEEAEESLKNYLSKFGKDIIYRDGTIYLYGGAYDKRWDIFHFLDMKESYKGFFLFHPEFVGDLNRIIAQKVQEENERCQIAKEIALDIKQKECRTEDTRCEIAKEIADTVVERECSAIEVNWDTTKTDIPIFDMSIIYADDPKKHYNCELKWLTLDEFLEWQCKTKNTTKEEFLSWVGEDTVNRIIEGIKKGNAFNAFVLEFDEEGKLEDFQEGRHRIIAMKRLGIERVPVYFCKRIY